MKKCDVLHDCADSCITPTYDLQAFIPPEEVSKVMRRAHWDEEREVWVLERLSDSTTASTSNGGAAAARGAGVASGSGRRGVSSARRPMSGFAKRAAAAGDMNPRFR